MALGDVRELPPCRRCTAIEVEQRSSCTGSLVEAHRHLRCLSWLVVGGGGVELTGLFDHNHITPLTLPNRVDSLSSVLSAGCCSISSLPRAYPSRG